VAGLAILGSTPDAVSAHGKAPTVATDFVATVTAIPGGPIGVKVEVLAAYQRLRLRVPNGHTVSVLGYRGEPFIRLTPDGVQVNDRSSMAVDLRLTPGPAVLDPGAMPAWRRLAAGHGYTWHDDRLRPHTDATGARVSGSWSVPIVVDGRPTEIRGDVRSRPAPAIWPWLLSTLLALGAVGLVAARCSGRVARVLGQGLASLAAVAAVAALIGVFAYQQGTVQTWVAWGWGGVIALFGVGVVIWTPNDRKRFAVLGVSALAASPDLGLLGLFRHGFVLSALPAQVTRAAVATSLVAAFGSVIVVAVDAARHRSSGPSDVVSGRADWETRGQRPRSGDG
jgi:hypothetical protein